MLAARARRPLSGPWSVEPYAVGGRVEFEGVDPRLPGGAQRDLGFQGRCGVPLRGDLSGFVWPRIDLPMQFDRLAFGRAALQLVANL